MKHSLSGILTDQHRHVIHAVVEEITASPAEDSLALQIMPPVDVPAAVLEHEIISGWGGRTNERVLGVPGKSVSGPSSTSKIYNGGSYQDTTKFGEKQLLKLRKYGSLGDRGATGLTGGELDLIERVGIKHKTRLLNRMCTLVWDSFFTGVYTWLGETYNFGIPSGNQITTTTDWTTDGSDPFIDLVTIVDQNPALRKYRKLIKGFVINPITEANIMKRALKLGYITNNNIQSAGINVVKKFAAPGLPDFIVVDDAWQNEVENVDDSITLSDAEFMVPDNQILILIDFARASKLFPKYGELQIIENMNGTGATAEKPAVGAYTFMDERGLLERKAPYVEVVSGFNGGPNLMRPNDVFIVTCTL